MLCCPIQQLCIYESRRKCNRFRRNNPFIVYKPIPVLMKNLIIFVKGASCRPFLRQIILYCLLFSGITFLPWQTALALPHPTVVSFTQQPANKKVCIAGTATFSVLASGSSTLRFLFKL